VFIEDCTWDYDAAVNGQAVIDGANGGRVVFRNNTVNNDKLVVHGYDSSERSFMQMEVYNNIFTRTAGFLGRHMFIRGGTGVFFNNTMSGADLGLVVASFRSCQPLLGGTCDQMEGYPCQDQIGRGVNQTLVPIYQWDNTLDGNSVTITNNGQCPTEYVHIQANRDYYDNTQKPGYTPYVYPHPLVSGQLSKIAFRYSDAPFLLRLSENTLSDHRVIFNVALKEEGTFNLGVYNARGQKVWQHSPTRTLPGHYKIKWDYDINSKIGNGVYIVHLKQAGNKISRTFSIVK